MTNLLKLGLTLLTIGALGTLVMGFLDYAPRVLPTAAMKVPEKVQSLFFLICILGAVIMLVPLFMLLWQS